MYLALHPQTQETEDLLEELMPTEEISSGSSVTGMIEDIEPLTADQKNMITELFDDLEVAHNHMARACTMLSSLSRSLSSTQLILVLKASIRPVVQLNMAQRLSKAQ